MGFVKWLASLIAREVTIEVIKELKLERETANKVGAIAIEAKSLMGELDSAQSESEKKAILRKISNFSDVSKHLL